MENFTPLSAILGGALIGLAVSMLLLFNGKVGGISGIVDGLMKPSSEGWDWRVFFTLGLFAGGAAVLLSMPSAFEVGITRSTPALAGAGLLVGFGTRLGSGCTSGHGICGLSRMSGRSLVATLVFMGAGMAMAALITHGFEGAL
jgi:uncharacterized membrane protein YedE/YeeE